jgi:hypothetical protein
MGPKNRTRHADPFGDLTLFDGGDHFLVLEKHLRRIPAPGSASTLTSQLWTSLQLPLLNAQSDNRNQCYLIEHNIGKAQYCHSSCLSSSDGVSCILAQHACTHKYKQYFVLGGSDWASFLLTLLPRRCRASALAKGSVLLAILNRHTHICSTIHTGEHTSRRLFLL